MSFKKKEIVLASTFQALDAEGNEYHVHVFHTYLRCMSLRGNIHEVRGSTVLETVDGRPVRRKGKGEYEVLREDGYAIPVTSDDKRAP